MFPVLTVHCIDCLGKVRPWFSRTLYQSLVDNEEELPHRHEGVGPRQHREAVIASVVVLQVTITSQSLYLILIILYMLLQLCLFFKKRTIRCLLQEIHKKEK